MWVSWGNSLPSYFGNPVVSVSYSCVTNHPKAQVFKIISIYCGSWVCGSAGWWHWSGSGSTDVSWVGSWACGQLGAGWIGWSHVSWSIIPTTFSWPNQVPRTAQSQRIAPRKDGMSWRIRLEGARTGMNEELGTFFVMDHIGSFTKMIKVKKLQTLCLSSKWIVLSSIQIFQLLPFSFILRQWVYNLYL